ncbi:hypothetical protein BDW59DRAFT_156795 [Aspergillus cavernicola]|uniref:Histidine-specific methyltransferase SAM-dependent domain-containing protein n=1 Tax=Aspergillus cavernicola TaxID=176166 RepID=A0ABR4J2K5_9EURO
MNLLKFLFSKRNNPNPQNSSLYGLDHAILNIPIPPPSMWMNLGYWKNTNDFPTACATLLDQVLITAGLLDETGNGNGNGSAFPVSVQQHPPTRRFRLLDVGIGCGDQSVRVLNYMRGDDEPLFDSYVGITTLPVQAAYASRRIEALQDRTGTTTATNHGKETILKHKAKIFCADAASPRLWPKEIHSSLAPAQHQDSISTVASTTSIDIKTEKEKEKGGEKEEEPWFLALDTLYHFHPSRLPLFTYTNSTLQANIMAFDLLLPSPSSSTTAPLSLITRLLLRLICLLTGAPYSNFLTQAQYTALLVQAGYDPEKIVFRDISEDVFAGIAGYIRQREGLLKGYGLGKGMGKFRGARVVFDWWARTGVVTGVIVVARV